MNHEKYLEIQMGGDIIKPIKYHVGEWEALNWFSQKWNRNARILDVGCGIGYGVGMMNLLGFTNVLGIDINPDKIELGKQLGYNIKEMDLMDYLEPSYVDIVWCSHSFEHMENADDAIDCLKYISSQYCLFYFILPYPDLKPAPAHCASRQIGLDKDDNGASVIMWFIRHGFHVEYGFDHFRESEIQLKCTRNEHSSIS